jgi:hypoxanthine phosphoribosyltransferase
MQNTSREYQGEMSCSWQEIEYLVKDLALQISKSGKRYDCILGITNGGIIPAKLVSRELGIDVIQFIPIRNKEIIKPEMPTLHPDRNYLVIDDILDTGDTFRKVSDALSGSTCDFSFCMSRHEQNVGLSPKVLNHKKWIVFPWE